MSWAGIMLCTKLYTSPETYQFRLCACRVGRQLNQMLSRSVEDPFVRAAHEFLQTGKRLNDVPLVQRSPSVASNLGELQ
jgi:hypothetical protein